MSCFLTICQCRWSMIFRCCLCNVMSSPNNARAVVSMRPIKSSEGFIVCSTVTNIHDSCHSQKYGNQDRHSTNGSSAPGCTTDKSSAPSAAHRDGGGGSPGPTGSIIVLYAACEAYCADKQCYNADNNVFLHFFTPSNLNINYRFLYIPTMIAIIAIAKIIPTIIIQRISGVSIVSFPFKDVIVPVTGL